MLLCSLVKQVQALCLLPRSWHEHAAILDSLFDSFVHHSHIFYYLSLQRTPAKDTEEHSGSQPGSYEFCTSEAFLY